MTPQSLGIITLTTDFGTTDHYVGALKGAILSRFADARVVDISHGVSAQAVDEGAYLLASSYSYFPSGTVHLAVVDPGVGTRRRAIAVQTEKHIFVGPDNGILGWALELEGAYEARELDLPPGGLVSATFHGRDVFAPAAARLAKGEPFAQVGPKIDAVETIERFVEARDGGVWLTKVVHVDRFGNLICGMRVSDVGAEAEGAALARAEVRIAGKVVSGISRTYSDAPPGTLVALFSSSGHLEVAVSCGDAESLTGAGLGADVRLRLAGA
jgi:S-adenosylmethionine hydrolase